MSRPRLLDLYSGAGGAAMGYHRAGFDVVGVDIRPQPNYPFDHVTDDAIAYLAEHAREFDAVHASPPCQRYSAVTRPGDAARHPDLYRPTVEALQATGLPYVVENVVGAPYSSGSILCGSMFGLRSGREWLQRHRNFETSWYRFQTLQCRHPGDTRPATVTGHAFPTQVREYRHSRQVPYAIAQELLGIDWMTRDELVDAIPPAYTEHIGRELLTLASMSEPERAAAWGY